MTVTLRAAVTADAEVVAGAELALMKWWPTRNDPAAVRARLVNVWTDPRCRRRGVARQLTAALLSHTARGVRAVWLSSEMGRPLYQRLGLQAYPHEMRLTLDGAA